MQDILKIDRAKWRTGGYHENSTGIGATKLLSPEGFMCCLGFRCNQLGIPKKYLLDIANPRQLSDDWEIPDLIIEGIATDFTETAVIINDEHMTTKVRERKIKEHFATKKIKVVFYGKYKK